MTNSKYSNEAFEELYKKVRSAQRMLLRDDPVGAVFNQERKLIRRSVETDDMWAITTEELNQFKEQLEQTRTNTIDAAIAVLPHREGGAAIGRNYRGGYAQGNNDTLDQMEAALLKLKKG